MKELCGKFQESDSRFGKRKAIKKFCDDARKNFYVPYVIKNIHGEPECTAIPCGENGVKLFSEELLCKVTNASFPTRLSFAEVRDVHGTKMQIAMQLSWKIRNAEVFLKEYAFDRLKLEESVHSTPLETLLIERFYGFIRDELKKRPYDEIKGQNALPLAWWKNFFAQKNNSLWLELVRVDSVEYTSQEAEEKSACEERDKHKEEMERLRNEEREEEKKRRELERKARRESVEESLEAKRSKKELLEAEEELAEKERYRKIKEKEHELKVAEIDAQIAKAKEIQKEEKERSELKKKEEEIRKLEERELKRGTEFEEIKKTLHQESVQFQEMEEKLRKTTEELRLLRAELQKSQKKFENDNDQAVKEAEKARLLLKEKEEELKRRKGLGFDATDPWDDRGRGSVGSPRDRQKIDYEDIPFQKRAEPLSLEMESPDGMYRVLLLSAQSILLGRGDKLDNPVRTLFRETFSNNDIILRRVEADKGKLCVLRSESRRISRAHCALSVRSQDGREDLLLYDVGNDGYGASNGTWLGSRKVPTGESMVLSDDDEIVTGKYGKYYEEKAFTFTVSIVRCGKKIESVTLWRKDALAESCLYTLVLRTAEVKDRDGKLLGKVRVVDGEFFWSSLGEEEPLAAGGSVTADNRALISVNPVGDAIFGKNLKEI